MINTAYRLNRAVRRYEDGIHAAIDEYLWQRNRGLFLVNAVIPQEKLLDAVTELQREVNDTTGLLPFDEMMSADRENVIAALTKAIERFKEGVLLTRLANLGRDGKHAEENRAQLLNDIDTALQAFRRHSTPMPRRPLFRRVLGGGAR